MTLRPEKAYASPRRSPVWTYRHFDASKPDLQIRFVSPPMSRFDNLEADPPIPAKDLSLPLWRLDRR